jgi:hypothetical protein
LYNIHGKQQGTFKMASRKYNLNDTYFSEPSIESAYWAGFLAADGNLDKRDHNRVTVGLSLKDLSHLKLFTDSIGYEGTIKIKKTSNGYDCALLQFSSKQVVDDLTGIYNLTPNKSLTLVPPTITGKDLQVAFSVGYIDGDGGLYYSKSKRDIQLQFVGTNEICVWIKNVLDEIIGNNTHGGIYRLSNQFKYSITSYSAYKIAKYVQSTSLPFMARKWNVTDKCDEDRGRIFSRDEYASKNMFFKTLPA